jgi:hypothetical protein
VPRPQPKLRAFEPGRAPEPKYFTRLPDDVLEDPGLSLSDVGVFAHLLKGNWTNEKVLRVTLTELAARCRITVRHLARHLAKFRSRGLITIARDRARWGAPCQITLTYELRPSLEMAPDVPVARGSKHRSGGCTHRTFTSGVDLTPRSEPEASKTSALLLIQERELRERGGAAAPPQNPPPAPWNSREQEVVDLAAARWGACNGDFIVGDLLRTCSGLPYSAELVMEAIDRHFDKVGPTIRPALLRATVRGMVADGWTPETAHGKPATETSRAKTYGIHPGP